MNGIGGECGQNEGSQKQNAFIPQCPGLAQSAAAEMLAGVASLPCSTGRAKATITVM